MINNLSKTINDTNNNNNDNNNEGKGNGNNTESLTGNDYKFDECISDFPINNNETNNAAGKYDKNNKNNNKKYNKNKKYNENDNNKANFADVSKMRKSTILRPLEKNIGESAVSCELTAMSMEKISPAIMTKTTVTTKTTTTITTPTKRISETKNRIQSAVTKKSLEMWKNKCQANEYNEISSARATLANTTSDFSEIYGLNQSTTKTKKIFNKKSSDHIQCELLESKVYNKRNLSNSGLLSTPTTSSALSLTEQKAKLRSDFFKDIHNKSAKGLSSTETDKQKTAAASATSKVAVLVHTDSKPKRLLKRCTNLKLKIHKTNEEVKKTQQLTEEKETVLKPIQRSLIEERKLELKRKFEAQTSIKTTTTTNNQQGQHNALQEFRRVAELIKKFDKTQIKMIVNPNKQLETQDQVQDRDQNMYTLKPSVQDQRHSSPLSDEGCNLGQSPYSTDDEHENDDNISIRTTSTTIETQLRRNSKLTKDKVARSASSDSALGLEVDDPMDVTAATTTTTGAATTTSASNTPPIEQQQKRRMTLTVTDLPLRPALLPLAEPTTLPDSPTPELQQNLQTLLSQTSIPSKVLLEERVVEIPEEPIIRSSFPAVATSHATSRRESEQSCLSDYPFGETPGVRYVRTPSVVVSDYSDDVMCGITLEEIEYFRAQRLNRRSSLDIANIEGETPSDVSASSSCSNLYYCGSTISALDGAECLVNGLRVQLERKISDCSTCSTSGNEDETTSTSSSAFTLTEDNASKDIADLLAAQHLSSKRAKKVGACGANNLNLYDNRI